MKTKKEIQTRIEKIDTELKKREDLYKKNFKELSDFDIDLYYINMDILNSEKKALLWVLNNES